MSLFKPSGARLVWSSFNEGSDKGKDERAFMRLIPWLEPALGLLLLVTLATDPLSATHGMCMPRSTVALRHISYQAAATCEHAMVRWYADRCMQFYVCNGVAAKRCMSMQLQQGQLCDLLSRLSVELGQPWKNRAMHSKMYPMNLLFYPSCRFREGVWNIKGSLQWNWFIRFCLLF